jgi:hypothetical protein
MVVTRKTFTTNQVARADSTPNLLLPSDFATALLHQACQTQAYILQLSPYLIYPPPQFMPQSRRVVY